MGRAWEAILSGEHLVILEDLELALDYRFPPPFDVGLWDQEITTNGGYNSSIIGIRLEGFHFSTLPDSFWKLSTLERLVISGNYSLEQIEDFFDKFPNLESLTIKGTKISSLPTTLSSLTKLKVLDLSFNKLLEVPESLNQLISLEVLNLNNNLLQEIPTTIFTSLKNLKTLNFKNNSITKIPSQILHLKNLTKLEYSPQRKPDTNEESNLLLPYGFDIWLQEIDKKALPQPLPHFLEIIEANENITLKTKAIIPHKIIAAQLLDNKVFYCSEIVKNVFQIYCLDFSKNAIDEVARFLGDSKSIKLTVSTDGKKCLVQSFNKITKYYDILRIENGQADTLTSFKYSIKDMKFIPQTDKIIILPTIEKSLQIVDFHTKEVQEIKKDMSDFIRPARASCFQISPDGKILLVGFSNGIVQAFNLVTLGFLYQTYFEEDAKHLTQLIIHPSKSIFTATDDHGRTFVRDLENGHYADKLFRTGLVTHLAYSSEGKYTMTFNAKKELFVYNTDGGIFTSLNFPEDILLLSSNEQHNFVFLPSGEWVSWIFKI